MDYHKMKRILLLLLGVVFAFVTIKAQAPKIVSGRVLDKAVYEAKREIVPFGLETDIVVFVFNTVDEAKDVQHIMARDKSYTYEGTFAVPDENGYYSVLVPETGALLVKAGIAEPVLEEVGGRREINTFIDLGIMIQEVSIIGTRRTIEPVEPAGERYGNILVYTGGVSLPKRAGKSNARMLIKPYVINLSQQSDTICYRIPRVYDGAEFHTTQHRFRGFIKDEDPLFRYVVENGALDRESRNYAWTDTVILPNANESFQVLADVCLEDYLGVYYSDLLTLSPRNPRQPLKFLEYQFEAQSLDPQNFKETPKREMRTGLEELSLKFLVNRAELDPKDTTNIRQLNSLQQRLMAIINGESSTLKELHITSVSSPDGKYESNLALSKKRLKYAEKRIFSMIPAYNRKRLYTYTPDAARVASWNEVSQLLEKDSLSYQAQAIRKVVKDNPGRYNKQSLLIKRLPFYNTTIVPYLPKLRSMTCEYKAEIYRELTPKEILDRYKYDPDYRTGRKQFELYEYWTLFNLVKDKAALENIYKQAYDFSCTLNRNKKPWVLAANNLAVSYLKRDTVDVSILEPLIDRSILGCNIERKYNGRVVEVVNREEIVANQLLMYLRASDFDNASILAQILPDSPKYEKLRAFAYCLKGYYKYKASDHLSTDEIKYRDKVFRLVQNSTPVNYVVMALAMNNHRWNKIAEMGLAKLSQNDALTHYLKSIVYLRYGDAYYMQAQSALIHCFEIDPKYIDIAKTDGDINEDFYKETMDMYQLNHELELLRNVNLEGKDD